MAAAKLLTQEELDYIKSRVSYDPITGIFIWLTVSNHCKRKLGCRADKLTNKGYHIIRMNYTNYQANRLAWVMTYGISEQPEMVDHKDNDKSNNRLENLRPATNTQNQYNSKLSKRNTTGVKGVCRHINSRGDIEYRATINENGKPRILKVTETIHEAGEVVKAYREKLHGEFCNHG